MQPIFTEMINMWKDLGYELPIEDGKFWLYNNFISGFTKDGNIIKIYKYKVYEDLHIEIKPYKDGIGYNLQDFETWEQTIIRNSDRLNFLEQESLDVITKTDKDYVDYKKVLSTSTGKDSMVLECLVNKIIPNIETIFCNTSLDSLETYRIVKAHKNWIIINPDFGFYNWIKEENYIPNRYSRGCCTLFKEGTSTKYYKNENKILFFFGIRNDESNKRTNREYIEHNPKWGTKDWWYCNPIRKWTELDIWLYTLKNNLEINPLYKKGYKRCGCSIACPFATKYTWVLDEYWKPKMRQRWLKILEKDFIDNQRWTQMLCTKDEYCNIVWNGTMLRKEPNDEVLNEFMQYKGFNDKKLALQYFNRVCERCGKSVRQKDVIAMNLKYHGRNTNKIYCKNCLISELNITKLKYEQDMRNFKRQGCDLF